VRDAAFGMNSCRSSSRFGTSSNAVRLQRVIAKRCMMGSCGIECRATVDAAPKPLGEQLRTLSGNIHATRHFR
jgi:hypothetical protein